MQDLGFEARMALQLELLPPAAKRSKFVVAPAAPAAAPAAAPTASGSQEQQAPPPPPPPGGFALQIKLLNGEALRGSFAPEAVLQEVAHYVDTHRTGERGPCAGHLSGSADSQLAAQVQASHCLLLRRSGDPPHTFQNPPGILLTTTCLPLPRTPADGGAPYHLVQPFPRRRFAAADMQTPLAQLGCEPRQALLLEPAAEQGRGGWSLGSLLATAKSWLNPYNYVTGPAGTAGGGEAAAAGAAPPGQQRGGGNVHTLHDGGETQEGGGKRDVGNSYWNGNSTEFGAGPPPPGQQ